MFRVVDDATTAKAEVYEENFENLDDAINYAETEWAHLTNHERKRRDGFFIGIVENENDVDILEIIKIYK